MWVNTFYAPPSESELVNLSLVRHVYIANEAGGYRIVAEYAGGERVNLTDLISPERAKILFADICDGLLSGRGYVDLHTEMSD